MIHLTFKYNWVIFVHLSNLNGNNQCFQHLKMVHEHLKKACLCIKKYLIV